MLLVGVSALTMMLLAYLWEGRSAGWILVFTLACATLTVYSCLSGNWLFGVFEGLWTLVALSRWRRSTARQDSDQATRSS